MDLEDEMSKDKKALLEEFERRRKARQLNVSTDDDEVTNCDDLFFNEIIGRQSWLNNHVDILFMETKIFMTLTYKLLVYF